MKGLTMAACKGICVDALRYGPAVAVNRYKFDQAKAAGLLDKQSLGKLHNGILHYLGKKYRKLLQRYREDQFQGESKREKRTTIWCFWWQGIEQAPELVKICVESIRRYNPGCDVIVLDQNNFKQYVQLPDHILEKRERGRITLACFSDILRFNLLKKHGGIWMDSTILCVDSLPAGYLENGFFTAKSEERISECVANYRWSCYLMAGGANNIVFRYMADFFDDYFRDHDTILHYFLVDYAMALAYEHIPEIQKQIDLVPINNEKRGMLANHLTAPCSEEFSLISLREKGSFYKLFWKQKYFDYTENGSPTVWYALKKPFLDGESAEAVRE